MSTDYNLSFGVLALEADLIDAGQFAQACKEWCLQKSASLADLLVERGWLTAVARSDLEHKLAQQSLDAPLFPTASARTNEGELGSKLIDPHADASLADTCLSDCPEEVPTAPFVPPSRSRYTLMRVHASGGIGRVWLARDDRLGRDVALKELHPEKSQDREMRARFLQEARITGQLEHPSIVPVYELREQPGGSQPFYVMRFIQGRTLSDAASTFHAKRKVSNADTLELVALLNSFVSICNAIAYAHARGVVHRDLKGPNVVLGDFGEVVVLDWGLAKVLGQAEEGAGSPPVTLSREGDATRTMQGQLMGTPGYLAPEQEAGHVDKIDARTDVYGLGAILYEVLTGQPPFGGSDLKEVLRRVREVEPARPRALWAKVPAALEAICLRALSKRPEERYPSARALAAEVQRYLVDEPVEAHRESLAARAARWARRHKTWVSAAVALLLTTVVALAIGIVLVGEQKARAEENFQKAEEQRKLADENFRLAHNAVDRYFVQVSESKLLSVPGLQPLRKELLAMAGEYNQRFVEQRADDPRLRADLGKAYYRLAWVTSETGSKTKAIELFQKALSLFEQLAHDEPDDVNHRHVLATSYNGLAELYRETRHFSLAEEFQRKALAVWNQLAEDFPRDLSFQSRAANTHLSLGRLHEEAKQLSQAEQSTKNALDIWKKLVGICPEDASYQDSEAWCNLVLAKVYRDTRRTEKAEEALNDALETYRRRGSEYSAVTALLELGNLYHDNGRDDASIGCYQEARAICQALARKNQLVPQYQRDLVACDKNLGSVYLHERNLKEAEQYYDQALALAESLADGYADVPEYQHLLAQSHYSLGFLYKDSNRAARALNSFKKALEIEDMLVARYAEIPEHHKAQADANNSIGFMLLQTNRLNDALLPLQKARGTMHDLVERYPEVADYKNGLAQCLVNLGLVHRRANQSDDAMRCYEQAIPYLEQIVEEKNANAEFRRNLARGYSNIGNLHRALHRPGAAVDFQRRAVFHCKLLVKANESDLDRQSDLGAALNDLGMALAANKEYADAQEAYDEAIKHQRTAFVKAKGVTQYRQFLANHYLNLARLYRELVKPAEAAEATLQRCELWPDNPAENYAVAADLALCIPLVSQGKVTITDEEERERRRYADDAMGALRRAVDCGFKDGRRLQDDPALEPLRSRADFKQLLMEINSKAKQDAGPR